MKIALKSSATGVGTAAAVPPVKGKRGPKKKVAPKKVLSAGHTFSASDNIQTIDRDTVLINGIQIDIEKITDEQLYSLRKILPRKDYR